MSNQSNKEIQVITNADFNGNEIKNAIIKNKQDTLVSGTNIKTINNQSILGSGNITIQGGGGDISLNEFIITQAIFDNYKNANNYANLTEIINNETITQNVINLNNYNFFLNNLIVSNKTLIFKNGNIVFDSNGVNGICDKAIVASSCNIEFRDCQISAISCVGITNALIDINNTNLTFENVIADDIKVSSTKTLIQATNACKVKINESDTEILNNDNSQDEPQNVITFIKVLNDNSSISINNSIVKINRPNNNLHLFEHKLISTVENVTVAIKIINSYLDIEDYGDMVHFGKEKILDINLDNTNIDIINSTLGKYCDVRIETKYPFTENETYQTDSYFIYFENKCTPEFDEEIFENVEVDASVFSEEVNHEIEFYLFIYNGEDWELNGTVIDLVDYGITYTLNEGQSLVEGTEIGIDYTRPFQAYNVLEAFTATSSNINEYLQAIKETVIDDTVVGIDEVNTDTGTFTNKMIFVLSENDLSDEGSYNAEFTYNGNDSKWYLKLYGIIDDDSEISEEVIIENYEVDLEEWGIELTYLEGYSLIDGMKFTITTESYITPISLNINNCSNSVLYQEVQSTHNNPHLIEFFFNAIGDTSVFGSASIITNEIYTDNINVSEDGGYFLPVHNENLESNNVKDAINELANKESGSSNNLFDIKTITEPETQRNWCCISDDEQKKLSRDEVDEAYTYVRDKLNDCDKELDTLATIEQTTDNRQSKFLQCYRAGEHYVVFNGYLDNPYYMKLYEAEDINDSSTWTKVNDYTVSPNGVGFVEAGYTSCYSAINTDNNDKYIVIINNEDLSTIKVIPTNEEIIPQFEFDGYFYGLANGATYRWKDSLDANEIEIELVVSQFGFLSQNANHLGKIFTRTDEHYYFNVVSDSGTGICACRAADLSDPDNYEIMGYWNYRFLDYNFWEHRFLLLDSSMNIIATTEETSINGEYSGHDIFEFDETRSFDEINDLDLSEFTSLSISTSSMSVYSSHWGTYILKFVSSNGEDMLFLTTHSDFQYFTKLFDGSYYNNDGVTSVLYDEELLVVSDYLPIDDSSIYGRLRISNAQRVEYTDTINGISIKYYKNGNWKICTAGQNNRSGGDTTDGKLQDVYDYLGYLNYWWVDEENEQFSLQRNSNLWTMMYVGNNYKDNNLPSGEYKPFALKGESSSGVSAAIVSANGLAPSAFGSGYVGGIDKYLTINSLIKTQDYSSWEIELIYTHGYNNNSLNAVVAQCENDKSGLTLNIDNNAQLLINILQDANTWLIADAYVNLTVVKGTTYYIKISYSNNSYSLEYKTNPSANYTQIWTYSGDNNYQVDKFCLIGTALPGNSQYRANASLLQDFKFVGDNNTIFQLSTAIEGTDFINTDCGYVDNKEVYFT